jgi:hypothetical protein
VRKLLSAFNSDMRASLTTFFCSLFLICAVVESGAAIRMSEEVLGQAERAGFDYRQQIKASEAGDERAVRELFLFTRHTDGAGALGHGVALVDLLRTIGEEMPARVAGSLNSEDQRRLALVMEAGVDYGLHAPPQEWTTRFPRMAAALRPFRFSSPALWLAGALLTLVAFLGIRRRLKV